MRQSKTRDWAGWAFLAPVTLYLLAFLGPWNIDRHIEPTHRLSGKTKGSLFRLPSAGARDRARSGDLVFFRHALYPTNRDLWPDDVSLLAAGCGGAASGAQRKVSAIFPTASQLFVGSEVRVLGVKVGRLSIPDTLISLRPIETFVTTLSEVCSLQSEELGE